MTWSQARAQAVPLATDAKYLALKTAVAPLKGKACLMNVNEAVAAGPTFLNGARASRTLSQTRVARMRRQRNARAPPLHAQRPSRT